MKVHFVNQESELYLCDLSGLLVWKSTQTSVSVTSSWYIGTSIEWHPVIPNMVSSKRARQNPHLFMFAVVSSEIRQIVAAVSHCGLTHQHNKEPDRPASGRRAPETRSDLLRLICMTGIRKQCLTVNHDVVSSFVVESFLLFSNSLHIYPLAAVRGHVSETKWCGCSSI